MMGTPILAGPGISVPNVHGTGSTGQAGSHDAAIAAMSQLLAVCWQLVMAMSQIIGISISQRQLPLHTSTQLSLLRCLRVVKRWNGLSVDILQSSIIMISSLLQLENEAQETDHPLWMRMTSLILRKMRGRHTWLVSELALMQCQTAPSLHMPGILQIAYCFAS
jgi:hypothetical protein